MADDRVSQVQQIKAANDIVDVIGGYIALRPVGQVFMGLCPFHDDHHPSFRVDARWQNYKCWACGKYGDVLSFVQEQERISFREALELLARRAGISLEKSGDPQQNRSRALMIETMSWATQLFHDCLLAGEGIAVAARQYLGERKLIGETVRRNQLGYAPREGNWLVQQAEEQGQSLELLEKVGLIAARMGGQGYYDRFCDRIMFPIRDPRGQVVGFGGRILPTSPLLLKERPPPKYYNSCDTPLFTKSEHLYGIDHARQAAVGEGYLAVVEGYTDVLLAYQFGVPLVVATMGTALNTRHVQQLRRFAPRVVLVFDGDEAGDKGVDRALQLFVSHDVDLRIATLPDGLDPCDLLVQQGADSFRAALTNAVDVLEFKLKRVLTAEANNGLDGRVRTVEAILGILAQAPPLPGQAAAVKHELMITRIAQRFGLKEETLWARLKDLRASKKLDNREHPRVDSGSISQTETRSARPSPLERDLLTVLLAEPLLVPKAQAEIQAREIQHPGLQLLLEGLYRLQAEGVSPDLDRLRPRIDNLPLMAKAMQLQEEGRANTDRLAWLEKILAGFRQRRAEPITQELQNQLQAASDHEQALELLRKRMQNRTGG